MTLFISSVFWLFTLSRWTLSMQRPDRRVTLIVDLNQVFTLCSVLKDLSTVHDVASRISAMRIALRTAGNRVICFASSIIPRELSSSGLCFCTSYHARASFTRLSMPYISLTDETMCLNSYLSVCCISLGCSVKIWRVSFKNVSIILVQIVRTTLDAFWCEN